MGKAVTSKKQKRSEKRSLTRHSALKSPELYDAKLVAEALLDCIRSDDLDTFREVLVVHLQCVNKASIAKKAGISRRTLYDLIDPKKDFNPELTTIAAVIRALAA